MIPISYPLSKTSPLYPGTPPLEITPVKKISNEASSSTSIISFSSHAGTHLDLPPHVCLNGGEIPIQLNIPGNGGRCICVDIPKIGDEPILPSDLSIITGNFLDIRAVLLRTGTWRLRREDPPHYAHHHPWIHPNSIPVLRTLFPNLKVVGVDVISITNPLFREEGREAHRQFLCNDPVILILEDLDLSSDEILCGEFVLSIVPVVVGCDDGLPVFCCVDKDIGLNYK